MLAGLWVEQRLQGRLRWRKARLLPLVQLLLLLLLLLMRLSLHLCQVSPGCPCCP